MARDAELQALRAREPLSAPVGASSSDLDAAELELLRSKAEEIERELLEERRARQAAEEHAEALERGRDELEATSEAQLTERDEMVSEIQALRFALDRIRTFEPVNRWLTLA